ncbi:MAG: hypothetical protein EZS28_052557 [Streblomastix strix]|uniref:C2 domain-containing protein n=1 Tax=Streblomastix strix TaxID=222440 RepID=A0A5J4S455_9EUKA|nr:MAG: hypothetical protein EZS28_052557 [Streblomastix strix]
MSQKSLEYLESIQSAKSISSHSSQKQIQQQQQYVKGVILIDNIQIRGFPEYVGSNKLYPQVDFSLGDAGRVMPPAKQTCNYDFINEKIQLNYDPNNKLLKSDLQVKVYNLDKSVKDKLIDFKQVDVC